MRELNRRVLIVCEGEKTEPLYFRNFRVSGLDVEVVGAGADCLGVVQAAIKRHKARRGERDFDEVWCVFDRDQAPAQRFNDALALAARKNLRVAYSNPAFELWYLLHFHFCNTSITRKDYCDRLSGALGCPYQKNDRTLYEQLAPHQAAAIKRAENLLAQYAQPSPADDNPSTTVHHLVIALNQYGRRS